MAPSSDPTRRRLAEPADGGSVRSRTRLGPTGEDAGPLSPRRRTLVEAATRLLGREGLRGLTHRGVDREARLPEGTCSAYWRTSLTLRTAVAEHVAEQLGGQLDQIREQADLRPTGDPEERLAAALEHTERLLAHWVEDPVLLLARLELTLAAVRDPQLRVVLDHSRQRMVGLVELILVSIGQEDRRARAEAMVAAYDGVLTASLLRPADERAAYLRDSVDLLSAALLEAPVRST